MAIDTAVKRASVISAGSFFPGKIPYVYHLDGSDANTNSERGAINYHYAGIDADSPVLEAPVEERKLRRPRRR